MNNKIRKAPLYFIKEFLKNPHIPIPYKRMLFSAIVIGQISYYIPLIGIKQKKNKERTRSTEIPVNSGLYWIERIFLMGIALHPSTLCFLKNLIFLLSFFQAECAIAQAKCFFFFFFFFFLEKKKERKKHLKKLEMHYLSFT